MRLTRLPAALLAGAVTAALYACLVPPAFTPLSYRFQTSLHGPHEARFLSGWRVEQHPQSHINIVTRLGAPRAVFELPPMPTRYPSFLRFNLIPRETCHYTILLNDRPVGVVRNTVLGRGEKFSLLIPRSLARPDRPNQLTVIHGAVEALTEWEWIEIRNYHGTVFTPSAYLLGGFEDRALRWQRLRPDRLILPGLVGMVAWLVSAPLRRMGVWWVCNLPLWATALGALATTVWLRLPLAISPLTFLIWFLGATVVIGLIRSLIWTSVQAVITTSALARRWVARWERWLRTLPHAVAIPIRRLFSEIVLTEIAMGVVLYRAGLISWRWLWRDPVVHPFLCFAGGLVAATFCLYLQWLLMAEWLGDIAFGMLIVSLSVVIRRAWMGPRPVASRR